MPTNLPHIRRLLLLAVLGLLLALSARGGPVPAAAFQATPLPSTPTPTPTPGGNPDTSLEQLAAEIKNLHTEIQSLQTEIESLKTEVQNLQSLIAKPQAPAANPMVKALEELGGTPCPNDSAFTCVTLTVPLDHFDPANRQTLDVVFGVLPASGQRKGMFVIVTGGPGTAGLSYADSYLSGFDPSILEHFDLVFFDCDSTLSAIEGIDELARHKGKEWRVGVLTEKAMNGDLDLAEVYGKRLQAIRPTRGQLNAIAERYWETLVPDAEAVIAALRLLGKQVFIVSGGSPDALCARRTIFRNSAR